jgi:hypothetical protein
MAVGARVGTLVIPRAKSQAAPAPPRQATTGPTIKSAQPRLPHHVIDPRAHQLSLASPPSDPPPRRPSSRPSASRPVSASRTSIKAFKIERFAFISPQYSSHALHSPFDTPTGGTAPEGTHLSVRCGRIAS